MNSKTYEVKAQKDGYWVASTPDVDRDGDRVFPLHPDGGIDTTDFARNPILFFSHDYSSPFNVLGTAKDWRVDHSGFAVKPEWREPATPNDPMHVIKPLLGNVLRSMSIGFIPRKSTRNAFGGNDYTHISILEVSVTGIPANQHAVTMAVKSFQRTGDKAAALASVVKAGNRELTEREIYAQIEDVLLELRLAVVAEQLEEAIRTGAI